MLVLTRKVGEGIAIGDDVKIIVMQIKGKQVRLGIKASASTVVHREEVYQRILDENKQAANVDMESVNQASDIFDEKDKNAPSAKLRKHSRGEKKNMK